MQPSGQALRHVQRQPAHVRVEEFEGEMNDNRNKSAWRGLIDSTKSFSHPAVGHHGLNRAGLHIARMATTEVAFVVRRALSGAPWRDALTRDGIAVIPEFADDETFADMQQEVRSALAATAERVPRPASRTQGFGPKIPFEGGFDRHDGAALNRFVHLDTPLLSRTQRFVSEQLAPFGAQAVGARSRPAKYAIQELLHYRDDDDLQKNTHRDTFQPALKLWYFLEDVRLEDGPFEYVRGSHRLNAARARWEYQRSVEASRKNATDRSGSFRVTDAELLAMNYALPESFPVQANTVVIANVRGFHRRASIQVDLARRVAIHASLRPSPFVPIPM